MSGIVQGPETGGVKRDIDQIIAALNELVRTRDKLAAQHADEINLKLDTSGVEANLAKVKRDIEALNAEAMIVVRDDPAAATKLQKALATPKMGELLSNAQARELKQRIKQAASEGMQSGIAEGTQKATKSPKTGSKMSPADLVTHRTEEKIRASEGAEAAKQATVVTAGEQARENLKLAAASKQAALALQQQIETTKAAAKTSEAASKVEMERVRAQGRLAEATAKYKGMASVEQTKGEERRATAERVAELRALERQTRAGERAAAQKLKEATASEQAALALRALERGATRAGAYTFMDGQVYKNSKHGLVEETNPIKQQNALDQLAAQQKKENMGPIMSGLTKGRGLDGFKSSFGDFTRYALVGAVIGGITLAMSTGIRTTLDYRDSLTDLTVALGGVDNNFGKFQEGLTGYIGKLQEINKYTGDSVAGAVDIAAKFTRSFSNPGDSQSSKEKVGFDSVGASNRLGAITGQQSIDAANQLMAVASAYGLATDEFNKVSDAVSYAKNTTGANAKEIADGLAAFGGVAKASGYDMAEAATLVGTLTAKLSKGGRDAAQALNTMTSILSGTSGRSVIAAINQQLGAGEQIDMNSSTKDKLDGIMRSYKSLGAAQQQLINNKLGGRAQVEDFLVLVDNWDKISKASDFKAAGKGATEFNRIVSDIANKVKQVKSELFNLMTNLADAGIFDSLAGGLLLIEPGLELLNKVLITFNKLPGPTEDVLTNVMLLVGAYKLLGKSALTAGLAQTLTGGGAGKHRAETSLLSTMLGSGSGPGAHSAKIADDGVKTGARWADGFKKSVGGFFKSPLFVGSVIIGLGMLEEAFRDSRKRIDAQLAEASKVTAQNMVGASQKEIASHAAALKAQAVEISTIRKGTAAKVIDFYNGGTLAMQQSALEDSAAIYQSTADRLKKVKVAAAQAGDLAALIDTSSSDSVQQSLTDMSAAGYSATSQMKALRQALKDMADQATGTTTTLSNFDVQSASINAGQGFKGGVNDLLNVNGQAAAGVLGDGTMGKIVKGSAGPLGRLILNHAYQGDPEMEKAVKELKKVNLDDAGDLISKQMETYLNSTENLRGGSKQAGIWDPKDLPKLTAAMKKSVAASIPNFKELPKELQKLLLGQVDVTVNDALRGVNNGSLNPKDLTKKLADMTAEQIAANQTKVGAIIGQVNTAAQAAAGSVGLKAAFNGDPRGSSLAQAEYVRNQLRGSRRDAVKALGVPSAAEQAAAQKALAAANKDYQKVLGQAGGDGKFGQFLADATGNATSSPADVAEAKKRLSDAKDKVAKYKASVDAKKVLLQQYSDDERAAEKAVIDAKSANLTLISQLAQAGVANNPLKVLDLQIADARRIQNTKGMDHTEVLQAKLAEVQLQNQRDAEVRATADAKRAAQVSPGSAVQSAVAQLQTAKAHLAYYAKDSKDWWTAFGEVRAAQQSLAQAELEAASNKRLLGLDMTNPVMMARNAYRDAEEKLRRDQAAGLSSDVLNADKIAKRNASTALDQSGFDQRLKDAQTSDQLGRTSHAQYLRFLRNEHQRTVDRLKGMSRLDNGYRMLIDRRDQLEGLLKDSKDSLLEGQWNLGDIKAPAPFEARQMASLRGGNTATVNNNQQIHVTSVINEDRLVGLLEKYMGVRANSRTTAGARKG